MKPCKRWKLKIWSDEALWKVCLYNFDEPASYLCNIFRLGFSFYHHNHILSNFIINYQDRQNLKYKATIKLNITKKHTAIILLRRLARVLCHHYHNSNTWSDYPDQITLVWHCETKVTTDQMILVKIALK